MSFNFVEKVMTIGGTGNEEPTLQFYKKGFVIGSGSVEPTWRDVILSGNTALTLVNAKANSLEYLKLFGDTEQNGTPTPDTPVDIVCNNGVVKADAQGKIYADGTTETVTVTGKNLFDKNTVVSGYRLSNATNRRYGGSNDYTRAANCFYSALIPVEVGKTYYKNTPIEGAYHRFKIYDSNQISVRLEDTNTITIQSGESYIAFCGYLTELDSTILSDSAINTANAEMLLQVGNNQDVQEVLTGNITRNVGIKVFDGTENWVKTSSSRKYCSLSKTEFPNAITTSSDVICSHAIGTGYTDQGYCYLGNSYFNFNYLNAVDDLDDFKQFLAEQYANGTPCIVIYPLSSPIMESASPQPLTIQQGTNIITAEGSIDNLPLEVSYKAGVAVRITEVQNAQLDNNVEVIIN